MNCGRPKFPVPTQRFNIAHNPHDRDIWLSAFDIWVSIRNVGGIITLRLTMIVRRLDQFSLYALLRDFAPRGGYYNARAVLLMCLLNDMYIFVESTLSRHCVSSSINIVLQWFYLSKVCVGRWKKHFSVLVSQDQIFIEILGPDVFQRERDNYMVTEGKWCYLRQLDISNILNYKIWEYI